MKDDIMNDDIPFPPVSANGKITSPPTLSSNAVPKLKDSNTIEEKPTNLEILEWCISVHERKHPFIEGYRHRYMLLLAYFCHDYGVDKSVTEQEFKQRFQRADVPEKEISDIINHCYNTTSTFGSKTYRKSPRLTEQVRGKSELSHAFIQECYQKNELGDAELLATLLKEEKLFDHTLGTWITYTNGVWLKDLKKQTRKVAAVRLTQCYHQYADSIHELVRRIQSDNKAQPSERIKTETVKLEKLYQGLLRRIKSLNTKNRLHNVLELATSHLACSLEEFDNQPHLLNLLNGVYDFQTGQLTAHNACNLFYHQSPIQFDSQAICPRWEAFLDRIFAGDKDLINFVRCCVAYSLTGYSDFQGFLYCYGKGANGKSVFFAVLRMLLGMDTYYRTIPIAALLSRVMDSTTAYHIATLKGARMVVASEIPKGRELNESQIKDLTGGERLSGRFPHGKPFEFDPTHTLWLFGNHKLVIKGSDYGIWRRVHMIPFKVTIPKQERKTMSEMLETFRAELPGIFNWAVEGYKYLQQHGWQLPEAVEQATQQYREESDTLGSFLEECCRMDPKAKCYLKDVFSRYQEWCEEKKLTPAFEQSRPLAAELRAEGYNTTKKEGKVTVIKGLKLLEKEDNPEKADNG